MNFLIPGGAGYIGSHMARYASRLGHEVVILDNFSTGNRWAVHDFEVIEVNLLDKLSLSNKLKNRSFDGVFHFAAKSLVAESVKKPELYFRNNVEGTLNLIDVMLENDNNNLIFSSSAAIFGNPISKKINENHPKTPINPYGYSKLMVEQILETICNAHNFNVCCFRYFNAAGADASGDIGEFHEPETHLIPNILNSCISKDHSVKVFGNDYDTVDGTCIRDYVHVNDLANAHLLGLNFLEKNKGFSGFNIGNSEGYSILDVINTCSNIIGHKINYEFHQPRVGDPAMLVADSSLIAEKLNWTPEYQSLDEIIETAWNWHKSLI